MPQAGSNNAFDGYLTAARQAVELDPEGAGRVSFTPGQRAQALQRIAPALATLKSATGRQCTFEFRPTPPFEENPAHAGWRHLGRGLVWQIEDALQQDRPGDAARLVRTTARFARDMMRGGAAEFDLGLALLDDLRLTVLPKFAQLPPDTLRAMARGMEAELSGAWMDEIFEHERQQMLLSVQYVQEAYRKDEKEMLQQQLGSEVREALEYLKGLRRQPEANQIAFFQSFAREADLEIAWVRDNVEKPVVERSVPDFLVGQRRPWRRFAKHFLRTLRTFVTNFDREEDVVYRGRYDFTLARTRLLLLTLEAQAQVKETGSAPASLDGFPAEWTRDPFTGRRFGYTADGPTFRIASAGLDGQNNGGRSDGDFETPDLVLEIE